MLFDGSSNGARPGCGRTLKVVAGGALVEALIHEVETCLLEYPHARMVPGLDVRAEAVRRLVDCRMFDVPADQA